jgi:hypothetical protein
MINSFHVVSNAVFINILLFDLITFRYKRNEVTGDWRELHNEELHALYSSANVIRMFKSRRIMRAGHVARMGEMRNAYKISVGKPEDRTPLGCPRLR